MITTTGDRRSTESESWVRVLAESGDSLIEVGSVGDIGRGERVHSVRFVGDVGYVATFRQIDPFYMIDLSDPAMPSSVGELKILGYSSYLHPIGDTLVLAFGSGTDEDGWITGARVSEATDRQVVRSIVIGDELWTLSHPYRRYGQAGTEGLLQLNGFKTPELLDAVDL